MFANVIEGGFWEDRSSREGRKRTRTRENAKVDEVDEADDVLITASYLPINTFWEVSSPFHAAL